MNRRRLLMSSHKIDVLSLTFSYTGSYTDTVSTMGGETYRLLTFTTSGTLTLDEKMVGRVPFDAWVIGEGGDGGTGESSSSYYSGGSFYDLEGSYHSSSIGCAVSTAMADGGGAGGDSEWKQIYSYQPLVNTISIDSGADGNSITVGGTAIISAAAGNNASGTTDAVDKTRYGTAWFTLPSAYNGGGGAEGVDALSRRCTTHDAGDFDGATGTNGGAGVSGIVYIRIPIDY